MKKHTVSMLALCASFMGLAGGSVWADAAQTGSKFAPMAVCSVGEKEGVDSHLVLHLSGFDAEGAVYYRAITSNLIELKVAKDGTVQSDANPCRDELRFFSSAYEAAE